jgi:hypothetical protein
MGRYEQGKCLCIDIRDYKKTLEKRTVLPTRTLRPEVDE